MSIEQPTSTDSGEVTHPQTDETPRSPIGLLLVLVLLIAALVVYGALDH